MREGQGHAGSTPATSTILPSYLYGYGGIFFAENKALTISRHRALQGRIRTLE